MIVSNLEGPPCLKDQRGGYDFKCVNQLCPYNMDVFHCYQHFSGEVKELFEELFELRSRLARKSEVQVEPECVQQI